MNEIITLRRNVTVFGCRLSALGRSVHVAFHLMRKKTLVRAEQRTYAHASVSSDTQSRVHVLTRASLCRINSEQTKIKTSVCCA